jgi:hypothetical protein
MRELFRKADERYNSGLFHFTKEDNRSEPPDELTTALAIDDKPLKDILNSLYYPESPYEFSVLPTEILGQVYEQFLGKVIRLTTGHRAVVEEKPEVRKAGGVYYTPTYIVDYIVKNTVGKLLEGKTPRQASKLKILDPACGSGSFLLGAYQFLLDWHRDRYIEGGTKKPTKELFQGRGGVWHLTSAEKKRILLNNIYGVDIDPQAVEVTKLSLLLKVLEGESQESLENQLRMFHERALPDLGSNIKCGNSLIGPDFYEGQQVMNFDEEERYRINVFDWQAEFPAIMKAGGFDAVIGNPPYIRIQTMQEWAPLEVEHYKQRYTAARKGNYDIYVVFVERGLSILNPRGNLGFILPHKFFNSQYGVPLRRLLGEGKHVAQVVHFGYQQVFVGATTYTCLLFLDKGGCNEASFVRVDDLMAWRVSGRAEIGTLPAARFSSLDWNFALGSEASLFERLSKMPAKLVDVADRMAQGIRTSANEVYVLDIAKDNGKLIAAYSKRLDREVVLERNATTLFLQGREIKRYQILPSRKAVIIPYRLQEGRPELIAEKELRATYPHTFAYLRENKAYLEEREHGRMRGDHWYGFIYPKNIEVMSSYKILVPDIADRASFALDETGSYSFTSGYAITLRKEVTESPKYVLGLLNAKPLDFFLKRVSTPLRGGFFRYFTQFIEQLPIRRIDFSEPSDKTRHDRMVSLVDQMLTLNRRLGTVKAPHDRTTLQAQIAATDRQIDNLVYELYALTADEIKIVEQDRTEPASPPAAADDTPAEENGDAFVYTPYQPALDAGISEEWDRKNARRHYLINRESHDQLTPEEKAELEVLQETVVAHFNTIFPRSWILDDDRLERLEEKYKTAKNP